MNIQSRLIKIESALRSRGCPTCAEREARMAGVRIDEQWLALYFERCKICESQKTWRDLADSTLDEIVATPDPSGVDVRTLTDAELDAIINGE